MHGWSKEAINTISSIGHVTLGNLSYIPTKENYAILLPEVMLPSGCTDSPPCTQHCMHVMWFFFFLLNPLIYINCFIVLLLVLCSCFRILGICLYESYTCSTLSVVHVHAHTCIFPHFTNCCIYVLPLYI